MSSEEDELYYSDDIDGSDAENGSNESDQAIESDIGGDSDLEVKNHAILWKVVSKLITKLIIINTCILYYMKFFPFIKTNRLYFI